MTAAGKDGGGMVDTWTDAMRGWHYAEATVRRRGQELDSWLAHCGDPWGATWGDVVDWLDGRELGAKARYCLIVAVHRFYVWAIDNDLTDRDPTVKVRRPRLPRRAARPVSRGDLVLAFGMADHEMRIVLALMAYGGLRCVEVSRLMWSDITDGSMWVVGKGGHSRTVPLNPDLERLLLDYPHRTAGRVVPASPNVISQRVGRYLRRWGIPASAHQLRHWFGVNTYAACTDIRTVQEMLGHASSATTDIYTRGSTTTARAAVAALSVVG